MLKLEDYLDDGVLCVRKDRIDDLAEQAKRRRAALVLGAGVSASVHLPDWSNLLSACFGTALASGLIRKTVHEGGTYLEGGENPYNRAHKAYEGEDKTTVDLLLRELTAPKKSIRPPLDHNPLENGQYFFQALEPLTEQYGVTDKEFQNKLFMYLVSKGLTFSGDIDKTRYTTLGLCAELIATRTITHTITYNFDTLLEANLMRCQGLEIGRDYDVFVDGKGGAGVKDRPVLYHVHGSIPISVGDPEPKVVASRSVVFAEDEYYDVERVAYNWVNVVQADFLRRFCCAFVGFSADDYNFRRIVKLVPKTEEQCHYLFIALDGKIKECRENFSLRRETVVRQAKAALEHTALDYLHAGKNEVEPKSLFRKALSGWKDDEEMGLKREVTPSLSGGSVSIYEAISVLGDTLDTWCRKARDKDLLSEKVLLNYYMELKENYWSRYRLFPIWTTYEALSGDLQKLL